MKQKNFMEVEFLADSINESFARICVATFCLPLNPSIEEISDIKTAVSEAVTNAIVHAYPNGQGVVKLRVELDGSDVVISVSDNGVGIKNFNKAREPFYTTKPDQERSGMGFSVMETFMDNVELFKNGEKGVKVVMRKTCRSAVLQEGTYAGRRWN